MTVKSHYDSDSIIPFPPTPPDSKESSSLEGVRRANSGPSAKQVKWCCHKLLIALQQKTYSNFVVKFLSLYRKKFLFLNLTIKCY